MLNNLKYYTHLKYLINIQSREQFYCVGQATWPLARHFQKVCKTLGFKQILLFKVIKKSA